MGPQASRKPLRKANSNRSPRLSEYRRTVANGSEQVRIQRCFPGSWVCVCSRLFGVLAPATWYRFAFPEGAARTVKSLPNGPS
jgi:hypothetical protein